jgi:D-psicose/D-tagatose/L-ribulose 3-epimerase
MLLGFNMLLWASQLGEEHFPMLARIKAAGYDGVELPLFAGAPADYARVGRELRDTGLRATAVCVIPDRDHDCTSSDPAVRAAGLDHLKWAIDCLEAAGGEVLCGPCYQPLGIFSGAPPTAEERSGIVEVHKAAARHAAAAGIRLAVEPLNRFECYALNTVADAAEIVRRVGEPNYGLLYDTFHVNIEEKDPVGAIGAHIAAITHVHASENDRGTPGKGHVPWAETFRALKRGGYDGWVVIEAFGRALPGIAEATRVWRDFFPHTDEVYQFGHDFLRDQWAKA